MSFKIDCFVIILKIIMLIFVIGYYNYVSQGSLVLFQVPGICCDTIHMYYDLTQLVT